MIELIKVGQDSIKEKDSQMRELKKQDSTPAVQRKIDILQRERQKYERSREFAFSH